MLTYIKSNKQKFDAYKYFTPNVERFFMMKSTSPKKINKYVNGSYHQEFQNSSTHFDEATLSYSENDGEFKATIISYSTYFKVKEMKQYNDFRTRVELKFDKDYRINFLREFYD